MIMILLIVGIGVSVGLSSLITFLAYPGIPGSGPAGAMEYILALGFYAFIIMLMFVIAALIVYVVQKKKARQTLDEKLLAKFDEKLEEMREENAKHGQNMLMVVQTGGDDLSDVRERMDDIVKNTIEQSEFIPVLKEMEAIVEKNTVAERELQEREHQLAELDKRYEQALRRNIALQRVIDDAIDPYREMGETVERDGSTDFACLSDAELALLRSDAELKSDVKTMLEGLDQQEVMLIAETVKQEPVRKTAPQTTESAVPTVQVKTNLEPKSEHKPERNPIEDKFEEWLKKAPEIRFEEWLVMRESGGHKTGEPAAAIQKPAPAPAPAPVTGKKEASYSETEQYPLDISSAKTKELEEFDFKVDTEKETADINKDKFVL